MTIYCVFRVAYFVRQDGNVECQREESLRRKRSVRRLAKGGILTDGQSRSAPRGGPRVFFGPGQRSLAIHRNVGARSSV